MKTNTKGLLCTVLLGVCLLCSSSAFAFVIESQLLGDPRVDNPDGLIVYVTIVVDEVLSPGDAEWTVDIDSPLHPDIKLDEFYFNMGGSTSDYTFSNFDPTGWAVSSPGSVQGGGAGASTFMFETLYPPPLGQSHVDVTNTQKLTFTMSKTSNFIANDFLLAGLTDLTGDGDLGSHQLGAHLLSLGDNGEDSGFAVGDYPVPEPSTILLVGTGLIGIIGFGRKRLNKKA